METWQHKELIENICCVFFFFFLEEKKYLLCWKLFLFLFIYLAYFLLSIKKLKPEFWRPMAMGLILSNTNTVDWTTANEK